ncbi:MAG TPA: hypothetical protein VMW91_09770 [Desulfosporosinus sp.]|nr:hypothetical protein [Desulfosporosinus sp.]
MEDYEIENLVKLCKDGLTTDGGHHKQWYLERVLLYIAGKPEWDRLKRKHEWEKGIVP